MKRNRLCSAMLAAMVVSAGTPAFAQETEQAETETTTTSQTTQTLDKVEVTGSRIKRTEIEGPAPVVVLTADDIEKEGFSTVYEALNTLSQFTGSVQNELTQSGFTPNAQFINLRSLGPGYTLILINGKRMADYPVPYNSQSNAVSLSSIPAAAVERIEVLTGGASAIYGSDAVAGVINIITKSNYEGDTIRLRGGITSRGGGDTLLFQWTGGRTSDNWSLTYGFEYLDREEILASQRDFMDSYYDNPDFKDDPNYATAVSGVYLYQNGPGYVWQGQDGSISTSVDNLLYSCAATSPDFEPYNSSASVSNDTPNRCGYFGYPATQSIQNAFNKKSGYLSGAYDFDNGMQAYGQFLVTNSSNKGYSSTQFWQTPGWVYDPTLGYVQAQRIFTPEEVGGPQATTYDETAYNLVGGLRGTMFSDRFDWDASVSYSKFDFESQRPRFLANKINDYFMGDLLGYAGSYPAYNVDVDRLFSPLTPETYQSLITTVKSTGESENMSGAFTLSGDLFDLPAGPLGAALVLEAAHQEYTLDPDPRTMVDYEGEDSIYNLTSTNGGGERDRYALGLEFSIPIFNSLKASLAGRFDQYDDVTNVDGAFTWSAGLEWRPFDKLLLRGSYATSFRAPDMHYVYAGNSGFYTSIRDQYLCRVDGIDPQSSDCSGSDYVYQVFGTRKGSTELEEEEGTSFTAGLVFDVTDNMSVTVDYYKIKLEGAVSDISTDFLFRNEANCLLGTDTAGNPVDSNSAACEYYTSLVSRDYSDLGDGKVDEYLSVPYNQSMQRTEGIDANWKYRMDTDRIGAFRFEIGYTHVLKLEEQEFPGSDIVNTRDHLQYFNFRSRANMRVNWEIDDWSTTVYGTRFGSLPNWAETGRIAPYFLWNLELQKKITNNATLGFAVTNIFDKLHPADDTYNSYPYFWRAYSPVGRQIYADFRYSF
ncbi:TonB-dependent receptor [Pseudoxanthomonas kalamensis DSM 18571]|nr:TonB-dependent receptor [Pseudoxanthomonas kalamensis DSM 18571]